MVLRPVCCVKSIRHELLLLFFFFQETLSNVQQIMNNLHTIALYPCPIPRAKMKINFLVAFLRFFTLLILEIAK